MTRQNGRRGLWDEADQFYHNVLQRPDGSAIPLRLYSLVGLFPLFAVEVLEPGRWSARRNSPGGCNGCSTHRPDLAALVSHWDVEGQGSRRLLSLLRGSRMKALLRRNGVVNHEIDASSIEVSRRARRAKTDRIDLAQLMRAFLAYLRGEPGVCSMVRVPTPEDEDRKRRTRERERLVNERTAHSNRIKGLLHGQGIRDAMPLKPNFLSELDKVRTGDGDALGHV